MVSVYISSVFDTSFFFFLLVFFNIHKWTADSVICIDDCLLSCSRDAPLIS